MILAVANTDVKHVGYSEETELRLNSSSDGVNHVWMNPNRKHGQSCETWTQTRLSTIQLEIRLDNYHSNENSPPKKTSQSFFYQLIKRRDTKSFPSEDETH